MPNCDYNEEFVLRELRHYLPNQFPLKDFIHHNTLHSFQHEPFHKALHKASTIFGYKTYLGLDEYRRLYKEGKIKTDVLKGVITEQKNSDDVQSLLDILCNKSVETNIQSRIGNLRRGWKEKYRINLAKHVQPTLFRLISSYLDQGILIGKPEINIRSFLTTIRELEKNSYLSLFKSKRVKSMLFDTSCGIETALTILIGDKKLFRTYLFDQQFEHPGWSGMVNVLEQNPEMLLKRRKVRLSEFVYFELLLEIDTIDQKYGTEWKPLGEIVSRKNTDLFEGIKKSELFEMLAIWQEAYEWSFYDAALAGLKDISKIYYEKKNTISFQGIFCLDDRECSMRRHLEHVDMNCQTFATAGHFNVEFYFMPGGGKFYTKSCPLPVTPKHIIIEEKLNVERKGEVHFTKRTHGLLGGWVSQTIGYWSAIKLLKNVFMPSLETEHNYAFTHMNRNSKLSIENTSPSDQFNGLQIGFTIQEMADRMEGLLKSIGLVKDFADIVYLIGHGASSANNTHYAAYDCGACSGKPGSVNARVAAFMLNKLEVRSELLLRRGISISRQCQFIGGMQDTTRDEIEFYDEEILSVENKILHENNKKTFQSALDNNAKERARRFMTIDNHKSAIEVHEEVKLRAVSIFEPRPEYNHATNAICIIGRRELSNHLFLDRRAFLNSFDYRLDPEGKQLEKILMAVAPVCGGINLEYYFSRVDNQRLGAGSKLPHNVVGLLGVSNGAEGDLRTGLPLQMVEIHDPLRLLVIIEHFPEAILHSIHSSETVSEWFVNEWINLLAIHPESKKLYKFKCGEFKFYEPLSKTEHLINVDSVIENEHDNISPFVLD